MPRRDYLYMDFRRTSFLTLVSTFTLQTKTVRIICLHRAVTAITGKAVFSTPETAGANGEVPAIVYIANDGKRRACSLSWRRRSLQYYESESQHR
jgi:hypothetical protein